MQELSNCTPCFHNSALSSIVHPATNTILFKYVSEYLSYWPRPPLTSHHILNYIQGEALPDLLLAPSLFLLTSAFLFTQFSANTLVFFLLLQHTKHVSVSGPFHLLVSLLGMIFPQKFVWMSSVCTWLKGPPLSAWPHTPTPDSQERKSLWLFPGLFPLSWGKCPCLGQSPEPGRESRGTKYLLGPSPSAETISLIHFQIKCMSWVSTYNISV